MREADTYFTEQHWGIWGPQGPKFHFWQPWLGGYNAELQMGVGRVRTIYARLWVDQELKEEMGH